MDIADRLRLDVPIGQAGMGGGLAGAALAAAVGPTAGALLVDEWSWRAVFLANLPVGAVAVVLTPRLLPESRETVRGRFPDVLGVVLLYGSLILIFNFVVDLLYGALDPRLRQP